MRINSIYSPTVTADRVGDSLSKAGIIAQIEQEFSLSEIVQIGDALLAAPVFATTIVFSNARSLQAITALRQRADKHMLVGVSNVQSMLEVDMAITAGAQFILSPYFDDPSAALAKARGTLYLPGVLTNKEAQQAYHAGYRHLHLFPADILGPSHLYDLCADLPECVFIPSSGITIDNVGDFALVGAGAAVVDSNEIQKESWSQAKIITAARALHHAWDEVALFLG